MHDVHQWLQGSWSKRYGSTGKNSGREVASTFGNIASDLTSSGSTSGVSQRSPAKLTNNRGKTTHSCLESIGNVRTNKKPAVPSLYNSVSQRRIVNSGNHSQCTHIQMHTGSQTHSNTHTLTQTQTHRLRHTHWNTHLLKHTHLNTHMLSHAQTHTHTHRLRHTPAQTHTLTHTLKHKPAQTHT